MRPGLGMLQRLLHWRRAAGDATCIGVGDRFFGLSTDGRTCWTVHL